MRNDTAKTRQALCQCEDRLRTAYGWYEKDGVIHNDNIGDDWLARFLAAAEAAKKAQEGAEEMDNKKYKIYHLMTEYFRENDNIVKYNTYVMVTEPIKLVPSSYTYKEPFFEYWILESKHKSVELCQEHIEKKVSKYYEIQDEATKLVNEWVRSFDIQPGEYIIWEDMNEEQNQRVIIEENIKTWVFKSVRPMTQEELNYGRDIQHPVDYDPNRFVKA